jgi:hypothetical protein
LVFKPFAVRVGWQKCSTHWVLKQNTTFSHFSSVEGRSSSTTSRSAVLSPSIYPHAPFGRSRDVDFFKITPDSFSSLSKMIEDKLSSFTWSFGLIVFYNKVEVM